MTDNDKSFNQLVDILKALRAPGGCNWDRAQTSKSLLPYLIEETYEAVEAAEKEDHAKLKEELGDILLHIIFQAEIAEEKGQFCMKDVVAELTQKMIDRHPHVFGDRKDLSPDQVRQNWEAVKMQQRTPEENGKTVLSGVPKTMPALLKAYRVQEKAAQFGFDWERIEEVVDKIDEELGEFKRALANEDTEAIKDELGDLLFSLVNFARHIQAEPEGCLNGTIRKFTARFDKMEKALLADGLTLKQATLAQMEHHWQQAKKLE
jgi:tetrapyrrole methylase family protein / MazG family protein